MDIKISSQSSNPSRPVLIKKCHVCGHVIEAHAEVVHCPKCNKHFLPLKYPLNKSDLSTTEFYESFSAAYELDEKDLIKGIYVLW